MAERVDITHDQGTTLDRRFVWETDDASPVPVDVTGYSARMHVRPQIDSATIVVELTTDNGRITLGGTSGTVDLALDADTSSGIDQGSYRYDLELEAPDGTVTRLIEGKLKVRPEVTRDA